MYIPDFAIARPLVTIVAMLVLVIFGAFALWQLDTDEFPDVQEPVVLVGISYPGGAPETVEREVLTPVEEAISGISGVDEIYGFAQDSYAQVIVLFEFGKNMQEASQEIRDGISSIRNDLPPEMEEPILQRLDPADLPIVSLTLTSDRLSTAELSRLADPGITRQLRALSGVAEVEVVGELERELTVELNPNALASAGVGVADVVQALETQNLTAPTGRLTEGFEEQSVRLEGRPARPVDFDQIEVATNEAGQAIRLGQVATVRDASEEARSLALYNAQEAVGIDVVKMRGYSTTEVSDRIRTEVETLEDTLPDGVELRVVRDAGERVAASVWNVEEALMEGAFLTVVVVFLFLNSWRSTVITGVTLPISVLASFIAVWAAGFTLNTMSLLGLSLAIGILIDDAIVVRENIVRHVEMGKSHYRAAHEGTAEIGLAVAATTFSIVAVFVPIAFISGVAGQWFQPFALTIACSVLVSLFVAFSLDPMLSAYWPDPHRARRGWITRQLDRFNAWFNRLAERYKRLIAWALDHPKSMITVAVLSFVAALALPVTGLVGTGFFPEDDRAELNVGIETPPGSSLAYTRNRAEALIAVIRAHPEVTYTYATLGTETGTVDEGNIYVRLTPIEDRDVRAEAFAATLRDELKTTVPGVTASVFTNDFQGSNKQIQLQLRGENRAAIDRAADEVLAAVETVPGAVDVGLSTRGQQPEVKVQIDRDQAIAYDVTVSEVAQALRPAFAGLDVGDWVDPDGETRDVVVRLAPAYRAQVADLEWLPLGVRSASAPSYVPLFEVAEITEGRGPVLVTHLDRDNVVTVEANVSDRPLSAVTADVEEKLDDIALPEGVRLTQGGEVESQNEVFGQIFAALGLAVVLMYLVLVLQFESFLDPLAIMISLPLSLIGVMLALLVTGSTISIMSLIGVILLMGIVAKNAILLIDFAKWAREGQGLSIRDALIQAGAIRLRPILMTTFALIAGMVPVALGSGEGALFRAPLGRAVIGGVITSTLLTLLVIPTVYELLDRGRTRLFGRFGRWTATSEQSADDRAPEAPPRTARARISRTDEPHGGGR